MDYDKLIERLRTDSLYVDKASLEIMDLCMDAAAAIDTLRAEVEQEHAHRIHAEQHADAFLRDCEQLNAELERVTAERDGAIKDMEALMWFSGEGCRICAHVVEINKGPYVRLSCALEKGEDCSPKWRSPQKED